MPLVLRQDWYESERGWGQRSDGYSLHLDEQCYERFVDKHWSDYEAIHGTKVPDVYSRPKFSKPFTIIVDDTTYNAVRDSENGLRYYN